MRNRRRRNGACGFLRRYASKWKRLLFFRNSVSEPNSTIQSCDYVQPVAVALRNVAVAAAMRLRCVALCCVELRECWKTRIILLSQDISYSAPSGESTRKQPLLI